jgi:hypothetical protein
MPESYSQGTGSGEKLPGQAVQGEISNCRTRVVELPPVTCCSLSFLEATRGFEAAVEEQCFECSPAAYGSISVVLARASQIWTLN